MDIKLAGEIITKFKPYAMIINRNLEILWISKRLDNLLNLKTNSIFNIGSKDILSNNIVKLDIGKESYNITKLSLKNQDEIILIFDLVGDYNDYVTKSFILEEIIVNLYDGVLLSDKEGKVVIYNHAMEELEERDSQEMLGEFIWDAYGYSDKLKSEHMQVFESGNPVINKYKAHAYNNGKPIYKSYSTFPIKKDGDIIGVYSISKNETKLQSLLTETIDLKRQFKEKSLDDNNVHLNGTRFIFSNIIGSSKAITNLIKEAQAISWLDNSILLVGDTGTGKEVFAQSIHNFGKRKSEPFIGINCSAIPENLLESILFGSVKGAYTGALDSSGLFEEAGE